MTMQQVGQGNGTTAPSAALAKRSDEELFRFGLEPQGLSDAMALCKDIAQTGMFSGNKDGTPATPASLLVRLMVGRSLGVPAMVALQHVYDVYGRPAISSRLKVALSKRHPECERFEIVESNDKKATYAVKRAGQIEKTFTFTIEEAARAGLIKKESNWEKWPRRMLEARAASHAADVEFPDAAMGLPTLDEAEDIRPGEIVGEVVPPKVPARDWVKEAETLKGNLTTAFGSKNDAAMKTARQALKAFCDEAPRDVVADLKKHYNALTAPAAGSSPTKPSTAEQAAAAAQATTQSAAARGAYLPPEQRGDSYDGPEDPPAS